MAESKLEEKEPLPGSQGRTRLLQRVDSVIAMVGSFLKTGGQQLVQLRDKGNLGDVDYRIKLHNGTSFTFEKLRDARTMKRTLRLAGMESVIIRTDTTEEGYVVSQREVK